MFDPNAPDLRSVVEKSADVINNEATVTGDVPRYHGGPYGHSLRERLV